MHHVRKKDLVFVQSSQVLQDLLDRVVAKAQPAFAENKGNVQIMKRNDNVLPKCWGGYEIPLHLADLSKIGIQNCYQEVVDSITEERVFEIACHFYADVKRKKEPAIWIAVIRRCPKSRKPGILIYWER